MAADRDAGFGGLLRRCRLVAGYSQQDLADRAGLSVDAVAALERGRRRTPRAFTVRVLADALSLDESGRRALVDAATAVDAGHAGGPARPPAPFGPLVGRDEESDAIVAALSPDRGRQVALRDGRDRLVTLTGPGGVGKTQLALTVAHRLTDVFPGGIGWAALAALDDPAALGHAVAAAAGLRAVPGRSVEDSLVGELASRTMLLVLDNCEHLVAACALLVERLLAGTSGLCILATSRERLRLGAERVWPVPTLAAPDPGLAGGDVADSPAVRLFVRRARQLVPDFTLDAGDTPAVAHICQQLDGIPLALELAAARTNVLTVRQIAAGLDDSSTATGSRSAPSRHRTLRSTIEWSHDLLTHEERQGLRQLAVFAGGWTLAAATAVCSAIGDERRALTLTSSLVEKSLAVTHPTFEGRYFLLFTVRRYALDRLRDSGEQRALEVAHARYVADLAERAEPRLYGGEQQEWLRRLDSELGNVRAALGWTRQERDRIGVRIAGALWRYCYLTGRYGEGRDWLDGALAGSAEGAHVAKALLGSGVLAFLQCDYDVATDRIEAALERYRREGDDRGVAEARQRLGSVARERGDYPRSRRLHEESLAHWRAAGDAARTAESLNYLGYVAWLTRDFDRTEELCEETLSTFRALDDGEGVTWALLNLGATAVYRGRGELADRLLRESLGRSYDIGFADGVAWSLNMLGVLARRTGDRDRAWELLAESLERHVELGDGWRAASVFEELAATVVDTRPTLAARLLGAAARLHTVTMARRPPVEEADHKATVTACTAALGEDAYEEQHVIGRTGPQADLVRQVRAGGPT
ncbi:MAG: tetratricopeptide repeat protein [Streptosporangiales bacterium]|nr:tetratricopeptide repeat protein [Streptosporangiales bacterium]